MPTFIFLLYFQGIYYVTTGLWALLDIHSFQKITGPKTDLWLVKTVGALALVIGLSISTGIFTNDFSLANAILGGGSALAFTVIDIYYVSVKRISPIYLLDAIVEIIFILFWVGTFIVSYRS